MNLPTEKPPSEYIEARDSVNKIKARDALLDTLDDEAESKEEGPLQEEKEGEPKMHIVLIDDNIAKQVYYYNKELKNYKQFVQDDKGNYNFITDILKPSIGGNKTRRNRRKKKRCGKSSKRR
jgi:hypothetical protein